MQKKCSMSIITKTEVNIDKSNRKPHQIIMAGSGDSLICNLVFYLMNIH